MFSFGRSLNRAAHYRYWVRYWVVTAALFVAATFAANAQVNGTNATCETNGCPQLLLTTTRAYITLPRYPGCEIEVIIDFRQCSSTEWEVYPRELGWRVPNDPANDTTSPCIELHRDYLNWYNDSYGGAGSRDQFLKNLFHGVLDGWAKQMFNMNYTFDSVAALRNPNNPEFQDALRARQCPNGFNVFRGVYATCLVAITKRVPASPPPGSGTERDEKEGGCFLAMPVDTIMVDTTGFTIESHPVAYPRERVVYIPCDNSGANITACCRKTIRICRNTMLNVNENHVEFTQSDSTAMCPPLSNGVRAALQAQYPNFTIGSCLIYCREGEVWIPGMDKESDPHLSSLQRRGE